MSEDAVLQKLADILPPPAPGGLSWMFALAAGAVVVLALVAGVWVARRRRARRGSVPAREARQRLAVLRDAWQARSVSDREAAYRLATLMRLGLGLPQLSSQLRPLAVDDGSQWHETVALLHALRYRNPASSTLSAHCFDLAERWLAMKQREAR